MKAKHPLWEKWVEARKALRYCPYHDREYHAELSEQSGELWERMTGPEREYAAKVLSAETRYL